jgi:hypothetical protein
MFDGARPGDVVRFVPGPQVGQPGAVMQPRGDHEKNAVIQSIKGDVCVVRLLGQVGTKVRAGADAGSASGIVVGLPVTARGTLKVS